MSNYTLFPLIPSAITTVRNVYFLGIGGIGMSALARWFLVNGYTVAGYDRTATALTTALTAEGIPIEFQEDVSLIPDSFRADPAQTLVVYTPAVPTTHAQYQYFLANGYTIQKRAQVLGWLAGRMTTIGVAGTHGKTTTSSMVAHLLRHAGVNCAAFLGGITQNYGTNFLLNEPTDDLSSVICVVEADEFDRSFLTLFPTYAIVTSTDADHLDIYGDHQSVLDSFAAYVGQIKPDGVLFQRQGLALADKTPAEVRTYSLNEGAYRAENLRVEQARFVFDLVYPGGTIPDIRMLIPGFHNVENALAAAAVALEVGVTTGTIRDGLTTYRGVRRRFEYVLDTEPVVLIDDYAHHPAEVQAFLSSVKALYPDRALTVVFQPHLFTRTRDFADGFAASLSLADQLVLLDIYPAREQPIDGVTSDLILQRVTSPSKQISSKEALPDVLRQLNPSLVVTVGAGDIDQQLPVITRIFDANR